MRKEKKMLEELDLGHGLMTVKADIPKQFQDQVAKTVNAIIPTMVSTIKSLFAGGCKRLGF
jgi:hypothetical protein